MKKLLTVTLVLSLLLSLSGCCCTAFFTPNEEEEPVSVAPQADNTEIVAFVETYKDDLIAEMNATFSDSSGLTCSSDVWVEGMGIVIGININELDDLDTLTKTFYKTAFSALQSVFDESLAEIQTVLPQVEYLEIRVGEADGDLICDIIAGEK